MSLLVRLYPRAWQDRYGDELSTLLEDRPPGPSDALDLILGAFDAHLHRKAVGIRPAGRDRTLTVARIGASAAIAGGALWILTLATAVREDPAMLDLTMLLVGLTLSLFVVALAALSAVQGRSHRLLMWASFSLPAVGVALLLGGSLAQVVVGDRPVMGELTPYAFWMGGMVLALAGSVLFGIVSAATGALGRWSAGLLSLGGLGQVATIMTTDHSTDEWLMLVGAGAFGLSWIVVGLGVAFWSPEVTDQAV